MSMIIDGTNGLTFNNATTQASAGQVLQVVSTIYSTSSSNTTSTFADTGLTLNITPKFATSKIAVFATCSGLYKTVGDTGVALRLVRNSTTLQQFSANGGGNNSTNSNQFGGISFNYIDSPATTSATTYKVQIASNANINGALMNVNGPNDSSSIVLMEIAQ